VALEHSLTFLGETNTNFWRRFDACVWPLGGLAAAHSEGGGDAFSAFSLHVFSPLFERCGWTSKAAADRLLRPLVVLRLGTAGHRSVLRSARRRFWCHVRGTTELPGDLRRAVFSAVLSHGGERELKAMFEVRGIARSHIKYVLQL
jgi:hypothetical protein